MLPGARPAAFPGFIKPQLATSRDGVPSGSDWLHEIKFDGYRIQGHLIEGRPALITRGGHDWTHRMPALAEALARVPANHLIVDGEIIVPDSKGRSDHDALKEALGGPRELDGTARIVDGDTVDLCSGSRCQRIRLCGIDTPERDQPGYAAARRALSALAAVEELRCIPVGRGTVCDGRSAPFSHDRMVAQCFHAKWGDVAGEMVARGHACDLTQFSGGHYVRERGGWQCPSYADR